MGVATKEDDAELSAPPFGIQCTRNFFMGLVALVGRCRCANNHLCWLRATCAAEITQALRDLFHFIKSDIMHNMDVAGFQVRF